MHVTLVLPIDKVNLGGGQKIQKLGPKCPPGLKYQESGKEGGGGEAQYISMYFPGRSG